MTKSTPPFPLLKLFNTLRSEDWMLGIDDYLSALQVMETGIGVGNWQELTELCVLLWAKTPQQKTQLENFCQQIQSNHPFKGVTVKPSEESEQIETVFVNKRGEIVKRESYSINYYLEVIPQKSSEEIKSEEIKFEEIKPENEQQYQIVEDPVAKVQREVKAVAKAENLKTGEKEKDIAKAVRLSESSQIPFPVTLREMKQSWRFLRRRVREGIPIELDVEATITQISRDGIFSAPILVPRLINRTDLILLIDQKGSMIPFHLLSRQLIETAKRDGRLRQANVYYFQNCPEYDEDEESYILFQQPTLWEKISLNQIMSSSNHRAVVMIISDAGAARGRYNRDRVKNTEMFLKQLQQSVRYCAWLNPMPTEYWKNTSASAITKVIPMFSLNRQGLNSAIAVLQGRYLTGMEVD